MSILSRQSLDQLCRSSQALVSPFQSERLRGASYDLSVGDQYYIYRPHHHNRVVIDHLGRSQVLRMPPNSVCYVLTEEHLNIPLNIACHLSLRLGLIKKGVMMARQPPIDPGSKGKIVVMLYNLSNQSVELRRGEALVTLEFHQLDHDTAQAYDGKYKNLDSLGDFIDFPIVSSLQDLRADIIQWERRLNRTLPLILTMLTAVVGIIALLVALFTISRSLGSGSRTDQATERPATMQTK